MQQKREGMSRHVAMIGEDVKMVVRNVGKAWYVHVRIRRA